MDNMPENVIVEILSRLPVKTLLCLKYVCKSWKSHISNPHFVNIHLMRNMMNPNYNDFLIAHNFVPYTSQKLYGDKGDHQLHVINKYGLDRDICFNLPLPVSTCRERFSVAGSCNGLLCLVLTNRKRRRQDRTYLWNPVTGQLKDIHMSIYDNNYDVSLGFCFDDASSDYKVVSIVTNMTLLFISRVEVYSLKQNCWIAFDDHVELKFRLFQSSPPAIVKGLFYWFKVDKSQSNQFGVVSFDVQSGKFCAIALPDGIYLHNIFEYKESVAICTAGCMYDEGIDIYTLVNESSWIKMLTINESSWIKMLTMKSARYGGIVGCLNKGEFVVQTTPDNTVLYDPANEIFAYAQLPKCTFRTFSYSVSLVNLN